MLSAVLSLDVHGAQDVDEKAEWASLCPTDAGRGLGLCQEGARAGLPGLLPSQGAGGWRVPWPCQLLWCMALGKQLGPPRVSQSAGAVVWKRWLGAPIRTSLHNFIKQIHPQSSWAVEFRDSLTPSSACHQIHFWRQHTVCVLTEFFQEMLIMGLTSCSSLPVQWDYTTIKMPITGPL